MWSEQVSGVAVESKLWPRGSALGERLWADPDSDWKAAEVFLRSFLKPWNLTRIGTDPDIFVLQARFLAQRERLVARGIAADAHQPEWCYQNEELCYLKKSN